MSPSGGIPTAPIPTNSRQVVASEVPSDDGPHADPLEEALENSVLLNRVAVGPAEYDVYALPNNPQTIAVVPEIDGPSRMVLFDGYLVPMSISIKEMNGFVTSPTGQRVIVGRCRWQIVANGQVIYSPERQEGTLRDALLAAQGAFQAIVRQMSDDRVRWWDEQNWRGRVVEYQGVRAIVLTREPSRGQMLLVPQGDADFPLTRREVLGEMGVADRPNGALWVDMLDAGVWWTIERIDMRDERSAGSRAKAPASAPADTVSVSSPYGPEEPEFAPVDETHEATSDETATEVGGEPTLSPPTVSSLQETTGDISDRVEQPAEATA